MFSVRTVISNCQPDWHSTPVLAPLLPLTLNPLYGLHIIFIPDEVPDTMVSEDDLIWN